MSKWQWLWNQLSRRLWLRSTLFCMLGVLAAFLAWAAEGVIPESLAEDYGSPAVDGLLSILANSMLVVTTFSLSTMVAAYAAATSGATPRSFCCRIRRRRMRCRCFSVLFFIVWSASLP
jgi:uncharacterized membrane protein